MKDKLIAVLEAFGYPVMLQGSLNPEQDYPDSFFTFWVFEANENTHYDNNPVSCDWGFWVYFYSNDPETVFRVSNEAKKALKSAGFVTQGKPIDANSDRETHTGTMLTVYIKEVYD